MGRPSDYSYMESHEWVKVDGDVAIVGITDFAVNQLNDLTFVDLPDVGDNVTKGESFGEIESVKAVSDLYAPVSGEVLEVHDDVDEDEFQGMKDDPFGAGWLLKIKMSDTSELETLKDLTTYESQLEDH